jgi:hypothetical protein
MALPVSALTFNELIEGTKRYDAVLKIDAFRNAFKDNNGWLVAVSEIAEKELEECNAVRVSLVGNCGVGKTWLIEQLGNSAEGNQFDLLSGAAHTEGLSVKIAPLGKDATHNKCVFLDTVGLNSPVATSLTREAFVCNPDPLHRVAETVEEQQRTEAFVRNVAFDFAKIFVLVVGQMTRNEQRELMQLIQLTRKEGVSKEIIVVHNLKNLTLAQLHSRKVDQMTGKDGPTYLETMQNLFRLQTCLVRVVGFESAGPITEMRSLFGRPEAGAQVRFRHVFLTKQIKGEEDDFTKCQNAIVFEHLRQEIAAPKPEKGSVLHDIARIMTKEAKNFLRLPLDNVEIRYHVARRRMVAGRRIATTTAANETVVDSESTKLENVIADLRATLSTKDVVLEAEEYRKLEHAINEKKAALLERYAVLRSVAESTRLDAASLASLRSDEVSVRPLLLRSDALLDAQETVKYNVSRVKGYFEGEPWWITMVHITLPGLAAGELSKLGEMLQWAADPRQEFGLRMVPALTGDMETLQIKFSTRVKVLAENQLSLLNKAGDPRSGHLVGLHVEVDERPMIVTDAGTRPFPSDATKTDAKAANIDDEGAFKLNVSLLTSVTDCLCNELPPVIHYGRGILTVAVLCKPSNSESSDPRLWDWMSGTLPKLCAPFSEEPQ